MIQCGLTGSSGVLGKVLIENYKSKIKFKKFRGDVRKINDVKKWINTNKI